MLPHAVAQACTCGQIVASAGYLQELSDNVDEDLRPTIPHFTFHSRSFYSDMSTAASEAITLLEESFTINYAIIAGAALIFFDHVITFGQEVQLFWGERSFSACLFFANRMLALVYASISVWSIMNFYTVICMANAVASVLVFTLTAVISNVVTILRVYAVTGGDRRPAILLALIMVFNEVLCGYTAFRHVSYSVVILKRTAICIQSYTSTSAQNNATKLEIANYVLSVVAAIVTLAILWRKLYVEHRPSTADLLSTRNPSLAALLLRDGTIQLTALLLLDLLVTILEFVNVSAASVVAYLLDSLSPVLISRVLLNIRAAARSTRGEQSQTPSFIRSRHGLQTQADVENMSFELDFLSSTEQPPESDRSDPQDSMRDDQGITESRSTTIIVVTAGGAQQDVNEEKVMDDVEEEMQSDGEDDE